MDRWERYFRDLLQENRGRYRGQSSARKLVQEDVDDITLEEIEKMLRKMKNNKAPGPVGIPI